MQRMSASCFFRRYSINSANPVHPQLREARYDEIAPSFPPKDKLRLEYFAEVIQARQLHSQAEMNALHGQHIWRDEVLAERFDWGQSKSIFALAVRVYRLPNMVELPMLSAYDGCKSWIDVDHEVAHGRRETGVEQLGFRRAS